MEAAAAPTGWAYLVGLPAFRNGEGGSVEAAEYRVWVRALEHVRPVDGVDYDQVVTERLNPSPQSAVRELLEVMAPAFRVGAAEGTRRPQPGRGRLARAGLCRGRGVGWTLRLHTARPTGCPRHGDRGGAA
ncbi:hypothetical protein GCM10010307_09410 [Streptomyces vastus]|uniref:Uncharacterized protein n=1 Tax=Streptomyces vastus TaxID=285451 RepID=A0ABN3QDN7_9ACTN